VQGQSVDIEIAAREVMAQRGHMIETLAGHSGQTVENRSATSIVTSSPRPDAVGTARRPRDREPTARAGRGITGGSRPKR
jgi:hypothetical protein